MLSSRRMKALTVLALQVGLTAFGCDSTTGVELTVAYPSHLEELEIRGSFADGAAFEPQVVLRTAETPPRTIAGTVVVLLSEVRDEAQLTLEVEGRAPNVRLSARADAIVEADQIVRTDVLVAGCGDGIVSDGESCDDSNSIGGDDCTEACRLPMLPPPPPPPPVDPVCGDRNVDPGETCDDGNLDPGDGCDTSCQTEPALATCGDGVTEQLESCDDGNVRSDDGCSSACQLEPGCSCSGAGCICCGNGTLQGIEICDDLNALGGDGCDSSCAIEPGFVCLLEPSVCRPELEVAIVDAAAACPGSGMIGDPYCDLILGLASERPSIVLRSGVYSGPVVIQGDRTLIAEKGAIIESSLWLNNGVITVRGLTVRSPLLGLEIDGSDTRAELIGVRIEAGARGVLVESGGTLTLRDSIIAAESHGIVTQQDATLTAIGCTVSSTSGIAIDVDDAFLTLERNRIGSGGVRLDTDHPYLLANNFIIGSGGTGVSIVAHADGSRFVNNTITAHQIGVECSVPAELINSIVAGNTTDIADQCTGQYSLIGVDPLFTADYRLAPGSPAIDAGDPAGVLPSGPAPAIDAEGDARPRGNAVDIGADEAR
jgi:cysteine-rich repeat protein